MLRLPNQDLTRPKQEQGVFQKYRVERVDYTDMPGMKHANCFHFVLDITHDPFARLAALRYAAACQGEYPRLAQDLIERVSEAEKEAERNTV